MALDAGTPAPDFTLNDSDGSPVTLSELRGTPIYLNFFPAAAPSGSPRLPRTRVRMRAPGSSA